MLRSFLIGGLCACALLATACGDDDGGAGGGAADAAVPIDGADPCDTDEMCDDGVFCNGDEVCDDGVCVFGPRRDCGDGVLCTIDTCSEATQACRHTAPDLDGDGHASVACVDNEGDPLGDDCDDENASRYPSNREVCDPADVDEDCDGSTYGSLDQDGDGFDSDRCCNVAAGGDRTCGDDCNDQRDSIRPNASEICDLLDNDCDGSDDEGVTVMQFVDADRDGHGDEGSTAMPVCASSVGFASVDDDCDDTNPAVHAAQVEICDDEDNDCDESVDEEENEVAWYLDVDGDGFGDGTEPAVASCTPPEGRSILRSDCNDSEAAINPASAELCDAIDNDCNGLADFKFEANNLEDDDSDGSADAQCGGLDCDDNDPNTGTGVEICDGYDNDCDDAIDEEVPNTVWYLDQDGDGFGDTSAPAVVLCAPISGRTPFGGDCADSDPNAFPGAKEVCNGRDDNCDGVIDGTPELINAGCIGQTTVISGVVYGPQGGSPPTLRSGSGRPNKPQGTAPLTTIAGASITIVHHTGVEVAQGVTNGSGAFNIRVPRGPVFVIVEPPSQLASSLVGSAVPVNGPRNSIEILMHTPSDLSSLSPTALETTGVILANITGVGHGGNQGIVIDPSVPTVATVGIATQPGNTLPAYSAQTWIPGGSLPFAMISAIDVPEGSYVITPLDTAVCRFTEGNFYGNSAIYAQRWPVRPNVITWVPVDCSPGLGDCCTPQCAQGCDDADINACMEALDPGDCGYVESVWDDRCIQRAAALGCTTCPAVSSCFAAHPSAGCDDEAIEACVCDVEIGQPSCCTGPWTPSCVNLATGCNAPVCGLDI